MAQKCVHKGCGKVFSDPEEPCVYHPGPPEFHEGQKGWKCCKPRFLTFDEFLEIPPCTTGKHSTVDDTPEPVKPKLAEDLPVPTVKPVSSTTTTNGASLLLRQPQAVPQRPTSPAPPPIEDESDDPSAPIPTSAACKRRSCGVIYDRSKPRDDSEECTHHPGVPIFHEGSKGWTCCKRRVLEFDEFMKIEGCKKRKRHLFVGKKKDDKTEEEKVDNVRSDFYQTPSQVIVSFYLKKIDRDKAKVVFSDEESCDLDLPTSDGKRFVANLPLWGKIDTERSAFKIMGTKLEVVFAKKDGASWPTVRSDERPTGEIIQTGRAGRA